MAGRQGKGGPGELSPRERDVLAEMALGLSNAEIARKLFISPHTVKNHITSIYRKMGVDDRTRVVLTAIRLGLVSIESFDPKAGGRGGGPGGGGPSGEGGPSSPRSGDGGGTSRPGSR